jgi:protein involved in ribonucleotide reduction
VISNNDWWVVARSVAHRTKHFVHQLAVSPCQLFAHFITINYSYIMLCSEYSGHSDRQTVRERINEQTWNALDERAERGAFSARGNI